MHVKKDVIDEKSFLAFHGDKRKLVLGRHADKGNGAWGLEWTIRNGRLRMWNVLFPFKTYETVLPQGLWSMKFFTIHLGIIGFLMIIKKEEDN